MKDVSSAYSSLTLDRLLQAMPDLYCILNTRLEIVTVSAAYAMATHIDPEAVIGRHIFEVFPESPGEFRAAAVNNITRSFLRVLKNKVPDAVSVQKYYLLGHDNQYEERYWSVVNVPVLNASNEVEFIVNRAVDVTDFMKSRRNKLSRNKSTEKIENEIFQRAKEIESTNNLLYESEQRLRLFVNNCKDYEFIILDPDGYIVSWNSGAEQIKGYKADEVIGKHFSIFYPESSIRDHLPEKILSAALKQGRFEDEGWRVRRDGTQFWANVVMTALYDANHKLIGFGKVTRDLSERKKNEIEREAIGKALVEKNIQLVNANLAKDQFLAHMSHELRTPLNGIIVMTQLLMSSSLTEDQKKKLEIIRESEDVLLYVINQILDFSKLESDSLKVENVHFDLSQWVAKTIAVYAARAEQKHLVFNCRMDPDADREYVGDPVKIRQVFSNILDNALKFTEKGEIDVRIHRDENNGNRQLVFEISDTGIGISPEIVPKIFKSFSQGDSSVTRRYGGTGLGLAISKGLVDLMGGTLEVCSGEKGTRFLFSVPCKEYLHSEFDSSSGKVIEQEHPASLNHGERILLVEDNLLNQKTMKMLLSENGYAVTVASNGIDALELLDSLTFDLILMDCQMPEMDGYQTTMEIRKREKIKNNGIHVPIIGVTAYSTGNSRKKCLDSGMDGFIIKPIYIVDLARLIKKHTGQASSQL